MFELTRLVVICVGFAATSAFAATSVKAEDETPVVGKGGQVKKQTGKTQVFVDGKEVPMGSQEAREALEQVRPGAGKSGAPGRRGGGSGNPPLAADIDRARRANAKINKLFALPANERNNRVRAQFMADFNTRRLPLMDDRPYMTKMEARIDALAVADGLEGDLGDDPLTQRRTRENIALAIQEKDTPFVEPLEDGDGAGLPCSGARPCPSQSQFDRQAQQIADMRAEIDRLRATPPVIPTPYREGPTLPGSNQIGLQFGIPVGLLLAAILGGRGNQNRGGLFPPYGRPGPFNRFARPGGMFGPGRFPGGGYGGRGGYPPAIAGPAMAGITGANGLSGLYQPPAFGTGNIYNQGFGIGNQPLTNSPIMAGSLNAPAIAGRAMG